MNKNDLYILSLLSDYLNNNPKEINTNLINKMVKEGLPIELAYRSLLIQILNIEDYNLNLLQRFKKNIYRIDIIYFLVIYFYLLLSLNQLKKNVQFFDKIIHYYYKRFV